MEQLTVAMRTFNERVKAMNQTNGKQIVLSAAEARSLHSDLFALLTNVAELSSKGTDSEVIQIELSGGTFK
jgi:hypothetical protein